jgi:addiction module HigA family antidote
MMKTLRDPKRKPTHPGMMIREDILPTLKITQGELADHLGVSRFMVSNIIHEKRSVTAEMAIRISTALGGSLKSWLRMQGALDLWKAQQKLSKN